MTRQPAQYTAQPQRDGVRPASSVKDLSSASSDYDLMRGIAAQQDVALALLFERYSGLVMAMCLRVLGHHADAEDTVLELFWEVWRRGDRYDPSRGAPVTYLLTLAYSRARDRRRTRGRQARLILAAGLEQHNGPTSRDGQPAEAAWLAEQRGRVRAAMGGLTPPQQQVMELAFFDGLTHREIAEKLDKPLGTIKTRIRQALIRLRGVLYRSDGKREP